MRDCLSNPRHAGLAIYRGEVLDGVRGNWEAILDEETHISLKASFADPSRRSGDHRRGRKPGNQLLSTVARCGREGCERTINASSRKGVPTYVCRDGHVTIPVHKVDMLVMAEMARGIGLAAMGGHLVVDEPGEVDTGELERLRERLDALAEPYAEGAITLKQFTKATQALREKIAAVEEAIASGSTNARALSAEEAFESFYSSSVEGKREFLKSGFDITIYPVGKGQRVDPVQQVKVVPRQHAT